MPPLRIRIVALIAAYAVALHTLLLAFAAVAPAGGAAHVAELCSGSSANDSTAPPGEHDAACAMACAMLGGTMGPAAAPARSQTVPVVALLLGPALGAISLPQAVDGPPRARAPPLG